MTSFVARIGLDSNWLLWIVGLVFLAVLLIGWLSKGAAGGASRIKPDETVVFFPTMASLDDGGAWTVPIHGWIFEYEEGDVPREAAIARFRKVVEMSADEASGEVFDGRARLFLVDNERGKRVGIRLGDQTHVMEASGPDGHFSGTISISAEEVEKLAHDGRLHFEALTGSGDKRVFAGSAHLIRPSGLSVISDIDDTVKVSQVTDKKELMANTFTRPFRAVDGMAEKYADWAEAGARFHYVSSSPWQLYLPLSQMLEEAGFPEATFELKRFRLKDSSVLKLFADPLDTKRQVIEPIIERYPKRKFILVGDSGEKDPEVYAAIARKYPERIKRIYIRDVTAEPADSPRYKEVFKDIPVEQWRVFEDPVEME